MGLGRSHTVHRRKLVGAANRVKLVVGAANSVKLGALGVVVHGARVCSLLCNIYVLGQKIHYMSI